MDDFLKQQCLLMDNLLQNSERILSDLSGAQVEKNKQRQSQPQNTNVDLEKQTALMKQECEKLNSMMTQRVNSMVTQGSKDIQGDLNSILTATNKEESAQG